MLSGRGAERPFYPPIPSAHPIGSRNCKLYHKASLPEAPNVWMVMVAKGPDCTLSDDSIKTLLQAMVTIQVRSQETAADPPSTSSIAEPALRLHGTARATA